MPRGLPTGFKFGTGYTHSALSFRLYLYRRRMPLNYSKWDQLEVGCSFRLLNSISIDSPGCSVQLSDDSDIEGHPNVDKKSLIRFVHLPILVSVSPSHRTLGGSNVTSMKNARHAIIAS